jgi:hypothetical protein
MHPFCLEKRAVLCAEQVQKKPSRTKSVPYGFINSAGCLEIRALTLPWKSCHFFAEIPPSENGNFLLLLALSQSLNLSKKE